VPHWRVMVTVKRRLGVALLLDHPAADEVNGLRRGVGDPSLDRIPPHLTLVPPVNVRGDQLHSALARLRSGAALSGPLRLTLGPATTFLPVNPVLYLEVGGDLEGLRALRDAVFVAPLTRKLSWPWVPHVTIADTAEQARIAAAVTALDRFALVTTVEHVTLLEETSGQTWRPVADAALAPPTIVGTGGWPLEITASRTVDPEAWRLMDEAGVAADGCGRERFPASDTPFSPIVLSARREGRIVGVGAAWRLDDGGHVGVVVAPDARRQGVGGTLLSHVEAAVRSAGWHCPLLRADGPAGFYEARSAWSVPTVV
jgi:2'-5' RNA ligase